MFNIRLVQNIRKSTRSEKMNKEKKSRKLLLIATVLTIAALVSVMFAYAAYLLGTFNGGEVTIGGINSSSTVTYSTTNSASATWTATLNQTVGSDWYARLEVTGGYTGNVTITWQLQQNTGSGWANVSGTGTTVTTNNVVLTGSAQDVYASGNGGITSNKDWGTLTTSGGAYRVTATVDSV
jgi:hypothetical protein